MLFNQPQTNVLTKNTDKLRQEVAAHIEADAVMQGDYWDPDSGRGCFIGCLAHSNKTADIELTYGLPSSVLRIAENIFEALPEDEARNFFAALPDAVACDGKDLSRVCWQFLAAELKALPLTEAQSVVDPVIAGMELLAVGETWPAADAARFAAASASAAAAYAAYTSFADASFSFAARFAAAAAAAAARFAASYALFAAARFAASYASFADAAAYASFADAAARFAAAASYASFADAAAAASYASFAARFAARFAAASAAAAYARIRQRDLLLHLISESPVIQ